MMALWAGIIILSGSWSFLTDIFVPDTLTGIGLLVMGSALVSFSFRNSKPFTFDKKFLFATIPLFLAAIYIPFPYNSGFWITFLGLATLFFKPKIHMVWMWGPGLCVAGVILMAQAAIFPFFFKFSPLLRELPFWADVTCGLLQIFGSDCAVNNNTVFVQATKEVTPFSTTIEKLAVYVWLNLIAAMMLVVLSIKSSQKFRTIIFILLSGVIYLAIRYIGMIFIYANTGQLRIFWNAWISVGSFIPLILLFACRIGLDKDPECYLAIDDISLGQRSPIISLIVFAGFFIGIFCIVANWGFNDPGIMKKGRIAIDEKHSNWEWTTRKYDTTWFGMKSGYNYYCLASYLQHFYQLDRNFEDLNTSMLNNYDVLIIKTPTSSFSDSEIDAIKKFVINGGGLFLVGDHTNVFGTSTYINPIAQQFGLRFRHDATYDLQTGDLSLYRPPRMLPHPVVQHITEFLFGSSCSLEVPWSVEDIILGYGLKSLKADYSQKNFFNEHKETPSMQFGQFYQSAGVRYGKGRVLAFSDSTVFSNFWLHVPGKPELLLGSINWLNRTNFFPYYTKTTLLAIGFFSIILSGFCAHRRLSRTRGFLIAMCASLLALTSASILFSYLNHYSYAPPQPHTKYVKVNFELDHSSIFLPISALIGNPQNNFHTFYVWTQRLDYVPRAITSIENAVADADLVFIINPDKPFSQKEKHLISTFVQRGGRVILMDDALNADSTANEVSQIFGMRIEAGKSCQDIFHDTQDREIFTSETALNIVGGKPLWITENNCNIFSVVSKGEGFFAVMSDSRLFSNITMGSTGSPPTPEQLKVYELEFWMLRKMLELEPDFDRAG